MAEYTQVVIRFTVKTGNGRTLNDVIRLALGFDGLTKDNPEIAVDYEVKDVE